MFANLNGWELVALGLLGLFIFGPDRLPKTIADGIRMLRGLRSMARKATTDLSSELGTEVRLEDLDPKTFIRQHLLSARRRPPCAVRSMISATICASSRRTSMTCVTRPGLRSGLRQGRRSGGIGGRTTSSSYRYRIIAAYG